jgi:hypothetical protein
VVLGASEAGLSGVVQPPRRASETAGTQSDALTRELFRNWSRCHDGDITRVGMQRLMHPIRKQVEGFLLRAMRAHYGHESAPSLLPGA